MLTSPIIISPHHSSSSSQSPQRSKNKVPHGFSRRELAAQAASAAEKIYSPPTKPHSWQIGRILDKCVKIMPRGGARLIKVSGVEMVLFRTKTGDRVGLQHKDQFAEGASNGFFLGRGLMSCHMMKDSKYITKGNDPYFQTAERNLDCIEAAICA